MTGALSKAYDVTNQSLDLPELQGKPDEIARHKVQLAAKLINGPAIVEDVSLHFRAWNGMPGPYIKDFMTNLGCDGIFRALQGCSSKVVTAVCTYAFCEGPEKEPVLFQGVCDGKVVFPRGDRSFGWDPIFQPIGFDLTFAELPKDVKNQISHRAEALKLVKKFLEDNQKRLAAKV